MYPSAEIYGGFRSSYDYGPLGSLMLRNVKDAWVRAMVQERDDVVLIDAAILGPPQVFEASGHLALESNCVRVLGLIHLLHHHKLLVHELLLHL